MEMIQNYDATGRAFGYISGWYVNYSLDADGLVAFELERDDEAETAMDFNDAMVGVQTRIAAMNEVDYSSVRSDIIDSIQTSKRR